MVFATLLKRKGVVQYTHHLQRQLLDTMYKQIPVSVFAHITLALLVAAVFYLGGSKNVPWWLLLIVVVMLFRTLLYRYYQSPRRSMHLDILARVHYISILASSFAWGVAPWLYFSDVDGVDYKVFFGFVMAGLTSGAVTTLSADRKTFLSFESVMLGSMILWFFLGSSMIEQVMGVMSAVYFFFLYSSSKQIHATLYKTLALQEDNLKTKAELEASQRRVDLLFDNVPAGIFFYDTDLVIQDVNKTFAALLHVRRDQLLGLKMQQLIDQRILPALRQPLDSDDIRQGHYEGNYRSSLSGVEIDVRATTTPLIDKAGNKIGAIGVVENIQKEMKQKQAIEAFAKFYTENPNPVFQIICPNAEIAVENSPAKRFRSSLTLQQWNDVQDAICHTKKSFIELQSAQRFYHFDIVRLAEDRVNLYGREITEERRATQRADYLAYYDELTDLPRRELLFEHIKVAMKRSVRHGYYNAIMFLDLDDFKQINDTMGHDVGDTLLIQLAQRLKHVVRDNDIISRFGGDEFVLLLEDLSEEPEMAAVQARNISGKILRHLSMPFPIASRSLHFTASIGITLFVNERNVYDLLKEADVAMYEAKKSGKNSTKLFDGSLEERIYEHSQIMQDLHLAVAREELQLYYQPQIDIESRRCSSAEALLRWHHPDKGFIPPDQFIAIAEESGSIHEIGRWVMMRASQDFSELAGLKRISVNVSIKEFLRNDYVDAIEAMVHAKEIDPAVIELELTESMFISDFNLINQKISRLSAMGFTFSIDDFGTGYSSLSYLKNLSIGALKIDKNFVRDIGVDKSDEILTHTILNIAKQFQMSTIAEGVENVHQLEFLTQLGCDKVQGYYFAKPMPFEAFQAWLKQHSKGVT